MALTAAVMAMLGVATIEPRAAAAATLGPYLTTLAADTYRSILATVEPTTGLPNDTLDASLLDIAPQFAVIRGAPSASVSNPAAASLVAERCSASGCAHTGRYGLRLAYSMVQPDTNGSAVFDTPFNAGAATQVSLWARGSSGGEAFEVVLWHDCSAGFPGRPPSALIHVTANWQRYTIPIADFASYAEPSSLCRLAIGFNDAIHPSGTVFLDEIRLVSAADQDVTVSPDEETNVANIGIYLASVLAARPLGLETQASARDRIDRALASIEALQTFHGFPQSHNRVASRSRVLSDQCIAAVDLGILAAGLILVRQEVPELAARAGALLGAMEWEWLYDPIAGLPYLCRFPDGSTGGHNDYLAADSRLGHLIAIGSGRVPASSWANLIRSPEAARCSTASHLAPGWSGGGLFMPYLPALFLRERGMLRQSASRFVDDQRCLATSIGAPGWGWSATALPGEQEADYCGFGCQRDDVLVPHASVLAVETVGPEEVERNLRALEPSGTRREFTDGVNIFAYGFRSSVDWQSGTPSTRVLVLDQGMAFVALSGVAGGRSLPAAACRDPLVRAGTELVPDYAGACAARPADFDADGRSDMSVFRPSSNQWNVQGRPPVSFGLSGDVPVPADYDDNSSVDVAVYRPSVGGWYMLGRSPVFFGLSSDVPVPADYDGDGSADLTVFRPSVGGWYRDGAPTAFFGLSGDIPVPGDYDGDGSADLTVFRPPVGGWYRDGTSTTFFGLSGDIPVTGDYDGDGRTDVAVFRPSVGGWYLLGHLPVFLGLPGDVPVPADYDGDGDTDMAVFRPSTGAWFVAGQLPVYFGLNGDRPLPLPSAIRQPFFP